MPNNAYICTRPAERLREQNHFAMRKYPSVLSIAGSDCSGGAGIQADIKALSALGVYAASAVTAVTVQNTVGVRAVHPVPPAVVAGQIQAVMDDLRPDALKTGMLGGRQTISAVAACLRKYAPRHVVCDPVMVSTSGHRLMEEDAIGALTGELMPLATLVTPNLNEAEALWGRPLHSVDEMKQAAAALLRFGCRAVLLKGGHLEGGEMCDVLQIAGESLPHLYRCPRIDSPNTHGTGCTLSAAIAAFLALGEPLAGAVGRAKAYVTRAIEAGNGIRAGEGHGPLNHFHSPVPMNIKEE